MKEPSEVPGRFFAGGDASGLLPDIFSPARDDEALSTPLSLGDGGNQGIIIKRFVGINQR